MTITIPIRQFVLLIVGTICVTHIIGGIIDSFLDLFNQTVLKAMYNRFHKKGGMGEHISKMTNNAKKGATIGFVDRTESK